MKRISIISPCSGSDLTGIPTVIRQLTSRLMQANCDVTLVLPKSSVGIGLYAQAYEGYCTATGNLEVEWWPASLFDYCQREQLLHKLEGFLGHKKIQHAIAFGIRETGYVSMIAGELTQVPTSVFVLYRDTFCYHRNGPHELEIVAEKAKMLLAANPEILRHILCFHDLSDRYRLLDIQPDECPDSANILARNDNNETNTARDREPYVLTTGEFNELIDYPELFDRVSTFLQNGAQRWIHAGNLKPSVLSDFFQRISLNGIIGMFDVVGIIGRRDYKNYIQNAVAVLRTKGEVNTGIGLREIEKWSGIPNLPVGFPLNVGSPVSIHQDGHTISPATIDQISRELAE